MAGKNRSQQIFDGLNANFLWNAFERGNLKPDLVKFFLERNHVTHILFNWEFVRKMHARDVGFDGEAFKLEIDSKWKVLKTEKATLYSF